MDVQGWITLTNNSGTPYVNANTLLVAGAVGQASSRPIAAAAPPPGQIRQAGTETADRERLGDFYLYPLPERTTIANRQTKQVSFLDVHDTPAQRAYEFRNGWLGTADRAAERQHRAALLDLARAGPGRRAAGGHGPRLSARRARQSAIRRRKRDRPHADGLASSASPPARRSTSRCSRSSKGASGSPRINGGPARASASPSPMAAGSAASEDTRASEVVYWQTRMRYTLTNARPGAGHGRVSTSRASTMAGTTPGSSRRACRASGCRPTQVVWQVPVPANGTTVVNVTFQTRY